MRIVFIGAVAFSHTLLDRLRTLPQAEVVGVVTRARSAFNADARPLAPLAAVIGCPCLEVDREDEVDLAAWIRERRPDVVYCFGWSWLLQRATLEAAPLGVIGYHPALLPANRGRHPIIWALALGLDRTGSTFFFMDEGADSGDILDQEAIDLTPDDDAASVYARLEEVGLRQMERFTRALAAGTYPRIPQDHSRANSWRKRGKADGAIDWRMSPDAVHNLVRALTRPYVGAHFTWGDAEPKLWRTAIGPAAPANVEPGKVLAVEGNEVVVKCGTGSLRLVDHELPRLPQPGEYLR